MIPGIAEITDRKGTPAARVAVGADDRRNEKPENPA
jgi:hypothetical protein